MYGDTQHGLGFSVSIKFVILFEIVDIDNRCWTVYIFVFYILLSLWGVLCVFPSSILGAYRFPQQEQHTWFVVVYDNESIAKIL